MEHPRPDDQFRAIAAINQQPVYFPNAIGMERLKWVWGILSAIILFIVLATWTIAGRFRDLTEVSAESKATNIRLKAVETLAEDNKRHIEAEATDGRTQMMEFYGSIKSFPFTKWYEQHQSMWEMVLRGENNKERFFREHGYPAPGGPEK
jgi:hypothetical protein